MNEKKVAVLLSTYNGEKYIKDQIHSVFGQEKVDVTLFIRDDGSTDGTKEILEQIETNANCKVFFKKNVGVVESFFDLLKIADGYDYYSFCDQDDVWDSDKLAIAISALEKCTSDYRMYYSKTLPVDSNLIPIQIKTINPDEQHDFNLHEVLLRNNAIGCTMVINRNLRNLLLISHPKNIIMHDHWIYMVTRALDGDVVYDLTAHIKYRQHSLNAVGHKKGIKAKLKYSTFFKNRRIRSKMANELLQTFGDKITYENQMILKRFAMYHNSIANRLSFIINESKYTKDLCSRILLIFEVLIGVY